MAENGKWQLGFWIVTSISVGAYIFMWAVSSTLASNMVCNDRLRQSEDARIEQKTEEYRNERNNQFKEILQRLTKIETKIDYIK